MNWEEVYKKDTGKEASYTRTDKWNANRTHTWHYDEYVCWLEDKLTDASQPTVEVGRDNVCITCGAPMSLDCPKCKRLWKS